MWRIRVVGVECSVAGKDAHAQEGERYEPPVLAHAAQGKGGGGTGAGMAPEPAPRANASREAKAKNEPFQVVLNMSSEGQPARVFTLGQFAHGVTRVFNDVTHITRSPVNLALYWSSRRKHLGTFTLADFIYRSQPVDGDVVHRIAFAQPGSPVFHVMYKLAPVHIEFEFQLNEVTCLERPSSHWHEGQLMVRVEFQKSHHSPPVTVNNYELGRIANAETSVNHTLYNLSFSTLNNFSVTLLEKHVWGERPFGTLEFVPVAQRMVDIQRRSTVGARRAAQESDDVANGDDSALPFTGKPVHVPAPAPPAGLYDHAASKLAAMCLRWDFHGERDYLLSADETRTTKQVHLILPSGGWGAGPGGTYSLVFTVSKRAHVVGDIRSTQEDPLLRRSLAFSEGDYGQYLLAHENIRLEKSDHAGALEMVSRVSPLDAALADATQGSKAREYLTDTDGYSEVNSRTFGYTTLKNRVELLIDGVETFNRYYEVLWSAKQSINILAWELSLQFGLIEASRASPDIVLADPRAQWVTLGDVLVSRARAGVRVRIMVWRHDLLSYVKGVLRMNEVTIEKDVRRLRKRCTKLGLVLRVLHWENLAAADVETFADPHNWLDDTNIVVIFVGNPKGTISCHHEKLVLVDAETPEESQAFVGGYDIARGRFDSSAHDPEASKLLGARRSHAGGAETVAPQKLLHLWHDVQFLLQGPATQRLHFHFAQRWSHAFTRNITTTRQQVLVPKRLPRRRGRRARSTSAADEARRPRVHDNCAVRLLRTWQGVFDGNVLMEDFYNGIAGAEKLLYVEQQYPFQNYALATVLCETLRRKPDLRVIIVTCVRTDLPDGYFASTYGISQNHINHNLHMIAAAAPDRVGVYGLVRQAAKSRAIKMIYVHTKLLIADDELMITGSANMDDISLFRASELSLNIYSPAIVRDTRTHLVREHLGAHYTDAMRDDPIALFDAFRTVAEHNYRSVRDNSLVVGRPVSLYPRAQLAYWMKRIHHPSLLEKMAFKVALGSFPVVGEVAEVASKVRFVKVPWLSKPAKGKVKLVSKL